MNRHQLFNMARALSERFRHIFLPVTWKRIEYFDDRWEERVKLMAGYIPADARSVLDLGCGRMALKKFIAAHVRYFGVDYAGRGEGTLICDFSKKEFPDVKADVVFVSGTMEYVQDSKWFVRKICSASDSCVISYCTTDLFPDMSVRRKSAWVSHLSEGELVGLFLESGFFPEHSDSSNETGNAIYLFRKKNRS